MSNESVKPNSGASDETAFLIERVAKPTAWFGVPLGCHGKYSWTVANEALRFCRKEDAERAAIAFGLKPDEFFVSSHVWVDVNQTITKVDWPGETSNMYQEPCPQCVKPAESAPTSEGFHNEFHAAFAKAAEPLIQFLNNHPDRLHPHHTVIVTQTSAELLEGAVSHKTTKYVKD